MFAVSHAKKQILNHLTDQDWTPTDLAAHLGKSPAAVYNHLNDLAERGALTTRQVPAKTRPKTKYSLNDGFMQYLAAFPGQLREGTIAIDEYKAPLIRIWLVPQPEFHPTLQEYWWHLTNHPGINFHKDIAAVGVYGSVARGDADEDSDIDILILTGGDDVAATVRGKAGSLRIETREGSRIVLAEIYTADEYRASLRNESQFLHEILAEIYPIYDPNRLLEEPNRVVEEATARVRRDES